MINTDAPINTIEEDKLNREHFVESLTNAIIKRSADDSLCIGLYGVRVGLKSPFRVGLI